MWQPEANCWEVRIIIIITTAAGRFKKKKNQARLQKNKL